MKLTIAVLVVGLAAAAQDATPPSISLSLAAMEPSATTDGDDLFDDHTDSPKRDSWNYPSVKHDSGHWYGDFAGKNPKARRCQAKKQDATSCPEPECKAWDWHDKKRAGDLSSNDQLSCSIKYEAVNVNNMPEVPDSIDNSGLDYDLRSEWLITYNAVDRAGNAASEAAFTMIMDDRVAPGSGTCGTRTNPVDCQFKVPFSTNKGEPDTLESCSKESGQWVRNKVIHQMEGHVGMQAVTDFKLNAGADNIGLLFVEDNYDDMATVHDTLKISVTYPEAPQTCEQVYDHQCSQGAAPAQKCNDLFKHSPHTYTVKQQIDIDTSCLGTYIIEYTANDKAGMYGQGGVNNIATRTAYINVVDDTAPVIHITGEQNIEVQCNAFYYDEGAICLDDRDSFETATSQRQDFPLTNAYSPDAGNTPGKAVFLEKTFDAIDGAVTVNYACSDEFGNRAQNKTRTITVVDTTEPSLTITTAGEDLVNRYCDARQGCGLHRAYGNYACDSKNNMKDACKSVTRSFCTTDGTNPVSCDTPDAHVKTVDACNWNESNKQCTLKDSNSEKTAADLAKMQENTDREHYVIEHAAGNAQDMEFIALLEKENVGFSCTDECGTWMPKGCRPHFDENCEFVDADTSTVTTWHKDCACKQCNADNEAAFNTMKPGVYVLKYDCQDSHNLHTVKCRTVRNEDKFKPVLTILGKDELTLEATTDGNYVDDGATCHDEVDKDIPAAVEVSGDVVKLANIGEYLVQYNCRDAAGNQAEPLTRKVVVKQSWGAVTAKVDIPDSGPGKQFTLTDMEVEERQLALRLAGASLTGLHEAAVKMEVYQWVGNDRDGECTLRLGESRRRLAIDARSHHREGSIGVKLIFAVPEPEAHNNVPESVSNKIRHLNFLDDLHDQANQFLNEIKFQQQSACGAIENEDQCNAYQAADCAWSGNCALTETAVHNLRPFPTSFDVCKALTDEEKCNGFPHVGCFYPSNGDSPDASTEHLDSFGTCTWSSGSCGQETVPECQNSITCTMKGRNPVVWEASFEYKDAGADCTDSLDIDPLHVQTDESMVDVGQTGKYLVTYKAQNSAGTWNYGFDEHQCAFTRTVYVVDTLKPVINLELPDLHQVHQVGQSRGDGKNGAWVQPAGHGVDTNTVITNPVHGWHLMAEVSATGGNAWLAGAAAAAVAGLALVAVSRKRADTSVPV